MEELTVGSLVKVTAGAYVDYFGPDEPTRPYIQARTIPAGDELVHKPDMGPSGRQREYKALVRHPLDEPLLGIYLGWRWRATGSYWPGGYEDVSYLSQDKRHKLCCVHLLNGDYYQPPFHCLPEDILVVRAWREH